jgi:membrane-bound serine protease (ClpP class)
VGITGIVMTIAGLVLAAVPTTGKGPVPLPAPEFAGMLQRSLLWSLAAFIAAAIGAVFLYRHFGSVPWLNAIALGEAQKPMTLASDGSLPAGTTTAEPASGADMEDPRVAAVRKVVAGDDALGHGTIKVGDVGRTTMQLRPSGKASIHGEIVDVSTAGEWVDAGRQVRVVEVAGYRIVVQEA